MDELKIEIDYSERGTSKWEQNAQNALVEMAMAQFENPRNFEFRYQNDNYNYKINVRAIFDSDGPKVKKTGRE